MDTTTPEDDRLRRSIETYEEFVAAEFGPVRLLASDWRRIRSFAAMGVLAAATVLLFVPVSLFNAVVTATYACFTPAAILFIRFVAGPDARWADRVEDACYMALVAAASFGVTLVCASAVMQALN